ncbi:MAG TPA: IclR family transcriptional regulator C-terminal domain-containing protein [Geminicoccaceae bacterium]|jgi:IclR family pca regulon transcriptional regulator|nr:IclR family transcriptional regulator C-terminal domain-containing protein [Geminicoccaceae bacterium]
MTIWGRAGSSEATGGARDFVGSLAKGLRVLRAFDGQTRRATLTEIAARTGLDRAAARRFLLTLTELGYVARHGRHFTLMPRVLELSLPFLEGQSWIERAVPVMKRVTEATGESCSASVLQDQEIVYVARIPTRRIMSVSLNVGSRLPAFHTSMGRVQLGFLPEDEIRRRLQLVELRPFTPYTIVDRRALLERIREDHAQGHALVDQELEAGLASIAVPLLERSGQVIAAINVSCQASRVSRMTMKERYLPRLKDAAAEIRAALV